MFALSYDKHTLTNEIIMKANREHLDQTITDMFNKLKQGMSLFDLMLLSSFKYIFIELNKQPEEPNPKQCHQQQQ